MNFEWAVQQLKQGKRVRRDAWPGHTFIYMTNDVIRVHDGSSQQRAWEMGQGAINADDWAFAVRPIEPRRVRLEDMQARIRSQTVFTEGTLTLVVLTMVNGYKVVGKSACVDPALYDADKGIELAYNNAVNQLWSLEGYLLAEDVYQGR